jgi:hypothetical protein
LTGRAADLARQPRNAESRLGIGQSGEFVEVRVQGVGGPAQAVHDPIRTALTQYRLRTGGSGHRGRNVHRLGLRVGGTEGRT